MHAIWSTEEVDQVKRRRQQAYKHGQKRLPTRVSDRVLLPVVAFLLVSGLYLTVHSRHARVGREVLRLEELKTELLQEQAELSTTLAELTSPARMLEQAEALGFRPATAMEIDYLEIEGYQAPAPFVPNRPPAGLAHEESSLSPAYTETLGERIFDWFGWGSGQ